MTKLYQRTFAVVAEDVERDKVGRGTAYDLLASLAFCYDED